MKMPDALTFSELRKIQKEEARMDELSELGENFLLRVGDYFQRKKEVSGEDREFRNAKRVFRKIMSLREDKIVKNAKIAAKSGTPGSDLDLLPVEQELFRELKDEFQKHRKRAEERTEKVETGSGASGEEDGGEHEEAAGEDGEEYDTIKVTAEIPEFMGTDLESYGPFEEGEEVKVPAENAEILVNRGSAEKIGLEAGERT